ncbi:MAG: hypothetical protein V2J24_21850 [Pseudomonadales bacterium]|nr:hypothetical protein [Pseudomonadales bacterium]
MTIGALLLAGMAAFLASAFGLLPAWPAGVLVWAGALLGCGRVDAATRRLSLALAVAGGAALLAAWWADVPVAATPTLERLLTINLPIVGLFVGVAFLSLAGGTRAVDEEGAPPAPARTAGLFPTLAAVHLVGAVINLSMTALAGDRLARNGRLGRREAIVLARGHCAAAFWSPFFVAAAVAHTYAPGADPALTVPLGVTGALLALTATAVDVRRSRSDEERATPFVGIVPDRHALALTGLLLASALGLQLVLNDLPMVIVVTAVTPPIALAMMPRGARDGAARRLLGSTLPATTGQVLLFLAAGVFAHGIATLLGGGLLPLPTDLEEVPFAVYPAVVAATVVAGYLGAHPVISIAAASSVLMPLGADPSLLAFSFLASWAVGTAVAPLSGMNLFLFGRYGVRPREVLAWGPAYALGMLGVVTALLGAGWLATH